MKRIYFLTGWILMIAFIFGIIQLMILRFSAGDIYPYYSSFRADPLGTKAFYESLDLCCDFEVQRNHEPFSRIKDRFDSTVLVLGLSYHALSAAPRSTADEINYFISHGGRLVITLHKPKDDKPVLRVDGESGDAVTDLTTFWGFRFFLDDGRIAGGYLAREYEESELPRNISVHTPLYFQTVHPGWKTVYHRDRHPVIIERQLGRGSLVISAESYFLSNQALAKERYPALLSWLVGVPQTVFFDEYHHGIAIDAGVMYLARKYDLEWLFGIFLLLAFLFIWKSATPLVPPEKEPQVALQGGKESVAGLTNLLRRNVPERQLLDVCYAEWQKSGPKISEQTRGMLEQIITDQKARPARQQNLASAYNALSRALKQRR